MSVKLSLIIAISLLLATTIGSANYGANIGQSQSNNIDQSNPLDVMGFLLDVAGLFAPGGAAVGKFVDGVTTGMDAAEGDLKQVIDDILMMIPGAPKIIKPGDDYFNPGIPYPGVKPGVS